MMLINNNLNPIGCDLEDLEPEIMQTNVFNGLRKCGWREMPWRRYVILSFDIVSSKNLNPKLSTKVTKQIPPYMLFFAIQIINTNKFQPIGKVFFYKNVPPCVIATCIKSFIRDLMRCEYSVVATVSRPISFFRNILENLVEMESPQKQTDAFVYEVEDLKVIHFFDPIAMLESTFLLFLKCEVKYKKNNVDLLATYDDCKKVMLVSIARDVINDVFNHTSNIICALRLFSMTFYREIRDCISRGKMTDAGTAEFCAFFDILFDSLHGEEGENILNLNRRPVIKMSTHFEIWKKSLDILQTMKFVATLNDKTNRNATSGIFTFSDDDEYYEIFDSVNKKKTLPFDYIAETRRKLEDKIKELELNEKPTLKESEKTLKNVEKKDSDRNNYLKQLSVISRDEKYENGVNEFREDKDFCMSTEYSNVNAKTETQDNYSTVDRLNAYSEKLLLFLKNAECYDLKKFESKDKISDNIEFNCDEKSNLNEENINKDTYETHENVHSHTKLDAYNNLEFKNFNEIKYDRVDNMEDYSKKLYSILENVEHCDVKTFQDNKSDALSDNDERDIETIFENNVKTDDNRIISNRQNIMEFRVSHFDRCLDYSQYFVNNVQMCKKMKHNEMKRNKEDIDKTCESLLNSCFTEHDFIDESEIMYSNEIVVDQSSEAQGDPKDDIFSSEVHNDKNQKNYLLDRTYNGDKSIVNKEKMNNIPIGNIKNYNIGNINYNAVVCKNLDEDKPTTKNDLHNKNNCRQESCNINETISAVQNFNQKSKNNENNLVDDKMMNKTNEKVNSKTMSENKFTRSKLGLQEIKVATMDSINLKTENKINKINYVNYNGGILIMIEDFNDTNLDSSFFLPGRYLKEFTANVSIIDIVLNAFDYIQNRLDLYLESQTLFEIVNFLKKLNFLDMGIATYEDFYEDQIHMINESVMRMIAILIGNKENNDAKWKGCNSMISIRNRLQQLLKRHRNKNIKKGLVSEIPQFFKNTTLTKENVKVDDFDISEELKKDCPQINAFYNEGNTETLMNVDFEESTLENNKTAKSDCENDFHPYILDAWQISINGAKKLFEFLQKKRFKELRMDSLNIDHIRQIMNNIKIDNGIYIENKYHIKITFIDASIVAEVFETKGTIILE